MATCEDAGPAADLERKPMYGHPRQHLQNSSGILQADAYAGFGQFYERRADGSSQFREAACWA